MMHVRQGFEVYGGLHKASEALLDLQNVCFSLACRLRPLQMLQLDSAESRYATAREFN